MSSLDPSLTTGVPTLDGEHDLQVQLLRALMREVANGDFGAAADLLDRLEEYTSAHFASEELLMRLHSYPSYRGHMQQHEQHVEELQRLRAALEAEASDTAKVADSMQRWLLVHIQTADQALAGYMREHGREAPGLGAPVPA